eukprot:gene12273-biopygen6433
MKATCEGLATDQQFALRAGLLLLKRGRPRVEGTPEKSAHRMRECAGAAGTAISKENLRQIQIAVGSVHVHVRFAFAATMAGMYSKMQQNA